MTQHGAPPRGQRSTMKTGEVISLLNADILNLPNDDSDQEIRNAMACDRMSDILAGQAVPDMLLTALNNIQVIRTASIFGITAVVIAGGNGVDPKVVALAKEEEITLLATGLGLSRVREMLFCRGVDEISHGLTGVPDQT